MPQIDQLMLAFPSQWFWLAIVLGLIYFVIGRGMLPKIEATVDGRDNKIADDLAAAQRARSDADGIEEKWRTEMNSAREEAQKSTVIAKETAAKDAEERLAKADVKISESLAIANATLAKAHASAMNSIESIVSEAAQDIVTKVSGANVSTSDLKAAVKAVLVNA